MQRLLLSELHRWKNSPSRKPLLLLGARQVGKTWLMKEFGKIAYKYTLYLNFDTTKSLKDFFADDISPAHIIRRLELEFQTQIVPEDTLLIFDEIQECQRAKDALKYFHEEAPQYHIIAAGSFLGVSEGKTPVGQVDRLTLYPFSFKEFLLAMGRTDLVKLMESDDLALLNSVSKIYTQLLKEYIFVGGMPAAIAQYIKSKDFETVRTIHTHILADYAGDFSKHIQKMDIAKVHMLWDSIPVHLSKEKHKFIYKEVKTGGRAAEFENAMHWLVNTGLVYKINRVSTAKIPLIAYQDFNIFKLYMLDIGLLNAMSDISPRDIFAPNLDLLDSFKGTLAEQFICQELQANCPHIPIFYWGKERNQAELDFVIQYDGEIIPIEVKSDKHTQAKSLKVYMQEYKPQHAIRTSLKQYDRENTLYSIPLYLIGEWKHLLFPTV